MSDNTKTYSDVCWMLFVAIMGHYINIDHY